MSTLHRPAPCDGLAIGAVLRRAYVQAPSNAARRSVCYANARRRGRALCSVPAYPRRVTDLVYIDIVPCAVLQPRYTYLCCGGRLDRTINGLSAARAPCHGPHASAPHSCLRGKAFGVSHRRTQRPAALAAVFTCPAPCYGLGLETRARRRLAACTQARGRLGGGREAFGVARPRSLHSPCTANGQDLARVVLRPC